MPLSSNATTTSHGLYKLESVVIVDLRMLAMYFYFLINHIELSCELKLTQHQLFG